ncbi:AMP-binding protein, partial [Bacillus thuringiensis]
LGVKPDDFVAIMAERSIEMIAGIYGIIKAGAAYVPIDPTYPEERIAFMLEDCQPQAMLLYGAEYETNLTKIDLKETGTWEGNVENPEKVNKAEDLIYCIYTSGTTGTPKGVLLEHHGVTNLAIYMRTELQIKSEEHIILFANYVFDGSVWEILMAHMNGATLYVPTDETIRDIARMQVYMTDHNINISYFPPAYYEEGKFELDGYVVTAGSQSNSNIVKQITEHSKYINSYGPTEVTICASNWICGMNAEVPENIPIGKPISNT